jgi:hypothetical protein
MNAQEYFKHARGLGAFTAEDCLSLAREAAALDEAAAAKRIAPPATVAREVVLDNGDAITLSFGVKVF